MWLGVEMGLRRLWWLLLLLLLLLLMLLQGMWTVRIRAQLWWLLVVGILMQTRVMQLSLLSSSVYVLLRVLIYVWRC